MDNVNGNPIVQEIATSLYRRRVSNQRANVERYKDVVTGEETIIPKSNYSAEVAQRFGEKANAYNYELKVAGSHFEEIGKAFPMLDEDLETDVTIQPDGMRLDNDLKFVPFKNICGKEVDCPSEMTGEEYSQLYSSTFNEMRESGELTDEMISSVTYNGVKQAYTEIVGQEAELGQ